MSAILIRYLDIGRSPFGSFWLDTVAKATVLLLAAMVLTGLLKRSSAAVRHRIWCLTFAALVLLPGLSAALPEWRLAVLPHRSHLAHSSPLAPREESSIAPDPQVELAFPGQTPLPMDGELPRDGSPLAEREGYFRAASDVLPEDPTVTTAGASLRHPNLAAAWLIGALVALVPLVAGLAHTLLLRRRSLHIDDADWITLIDELRQRLTLSRRVRLYENASALMPMTWGVLRPVVMLPRQAREWTGRLWRVVLLHELAHIKRCDVGFQLLGRGACAMYWFHPLAWYALRRLRIERELACDDCVVLAGERATEYASELLQIARAYRTVPFAAAIAMAQRSNLEHRLRAMFDRACSHLPLGARAARLLLSAALLFVTAVSVVRLAPRAKADDETQSGAPNESLPKDDLITVSGQVVDPDGRPFSGAKVSAVRWYWEPHIPHLPLAETRSDSDGRFTLDFRKSQFNIDLGQLNQWKNTTIVATAQGFAPTWVGWKNISTNNDATLKLTADDMPVTGRVVDLEGHPLAGVQVRTGSVYMAENGTLDDWIDAVRGGEFPPSAGRHLGDSLPQVDSLSPEAVTDTDGRFRIDGLGRERLVEVVFSGPTIAHSRARLVTRRAEPFSQQMGDGPLDRSIPVYGAQLEFAALPTRPIVGAVRDAETGRPLPGVSIESWRFSGSNYVNERGLRAVTDAAGRYRLAGLPKGKGNELLAVPNDDQPYFMRKMDVPDEPGLASITVDIELHRGIRVTGRVTDLATREPLPVRLYYLPFRSNQFARDFPEFDTRAGHVDGWGYQDRYTTRPDGTYRLVALPGRAIIGALSVMHSYRHGVGAETIAGMNDRGTFDTYQNPVEPGRKWPNILKEINPPPGVEEIVCDLALDRGATITVNVVDVEGRPLTGFEVEGRSAGFEATSPVLESKIDVINLGPDETRTVIIRHKELNIGKAVRLRTADHPQGTATVTLEPYATVVGRVVDRNGDPVAGAEITAWVRPTEDFSKRLGPVATGSDGRFEYSHVPVGCRYDLQMKSRGISSAEVGDDLDLAPGEARDLGDVTISREAKADGKQAARPTDTKLTKDVSSTLPSGLVQLSGSLVDSSDAGSSSNDKAASSQSPEATGVVTLRGRVLDPESKPLAGATLYLSYPTRTRIASQLLGTSGEEGRFEFRVDTSNFDRSFMVDPWTRARLTAVAEGYGVEWTEAAKAAAAGDFTLQLVKDLPIHGRILSLEGQPVPGAKIRLRQLRIPAERNLDAYIEAQRAGRTTTYRFERLAAKVDGLPETAVTDEQGRFTLTGYGAERLVELFVEGPGIQHWYIFVMTRETETVAEAPEVQMRSIPDRTYGATFDHLAPPARSIVGTVRERSTQKPIAGVTIQCIGQTTHYPKTDEQGHFALLGVAKAKEHYLDAEAKGLPYFSTRLRINDTPGLDPIHVEIELGRGLEATGRVTLAESGEANRAQVEYYPLWLNPNTDRIGPQLARPCSSATCDDDGRYTIPILPGPGILTYRFGPYSRTTYREYMPAWLSKQDIEAFYESAGLKAPPDMTEGFVHVSAGGQALSSIITSNYNHVELINPGEADASFSRDIKLALGRTLTVKVVDPDGQPLAGTKVHGVGNASFEIDNADGPEFTITGLNPQIERLLIVELPEKRLGAYRVVRGDEEGPIEVRLQPCASIVGRVVDADGEPMAKTMIGVGRPRRLPPEFTPTTDADGRFRVDGLVPGIEYEVGSLKRGSVPTRLKEFTLMPGEERNLGDVSTGPVQGAQPPSTEPGQKLDMGD